LFAFELKIKIRLAWWCKNSVSEQICKAAFHPFLLKTDGFVWTKMLNY